MLRFEADPAGAEEGQLVGLALTFLDEEQTRIEWSVADHEGGLDAKTFELQRSAPVEELAAEVARIRVSLDSLQSELDRRMKRSVTVRAKGQKDRVLLETRTLPPGPGWNVSGVPMRQWLMNQTMLFAST